MNKYKIFNNAVEINVEVSPEKSLILLKYECILLHFKVTNLSDLIIGIKNGGDNRNFLGRSLSYTMIIENERTHEILPDAFPSIPNFGGRYWFPPVRKGEVFEKDLFLRHWVVFEKEGNYKIQVNAKLKIELKDHNPEWKEDLEVSCSCNLEVVKGTDLEVEKFIGSMIGKCGGENLDRVDMDDEKVMITKKLKWSNHELTIPFFTKIIKLKKREHYYRALDCLSKFKKDEALEGMLCIFDLTPKDYIPYCRNIDMARERLLSLHHSLVNCLIRSVHPKAIDHVFAMAYHENKNVRHSICHLMEKSIGFKNFCVMEKYLADKDDYIRKSAKKYVDKHPIEKYRQLMVKDLSFLDVLVICVL